MKNHSGISADAMFSLWANDCRCMMWWCAYDQNYHEYTPYEWISFERELGLIRNNRDVKPNLIEVKKFIDMVNSLGFTLPERKIDAVCILTEGQKQWSAAYSSMILAKQAGFELEFQMANQPLRDASSI